MIQAFAPRMTRGGSWVPLAIVALAFSAMPAPSMAQAPKEEPKARAPEAKPAAKEGADSETGVAEVFIDPNAKKTLAIFNPLTFSGAPIRVGNPPDDRTKVQNMAARAENVDRAFLKRYIEFFAAELSKRDNLNALLNPPPNAKANAPQARALETAVDALTKPIIDAKANNNNDFLTEYQRALFDSSLIKLLDNNYLARIDAMIVLGMAGSPAPTAINVYIAQIKKPDQVVWVKLWAARGLANAAQEGRINLEATKTIESAEALIGLLDSDPKMPWPVQMRALEALGALRLATANTTRGKIDAASVAMRFLADASARPEVRSWAAWALGMMKVSPQVTPTYNFELVGHETGELAVELGRRIVEEFDARAAVFDKEKDQASHLTSLLLFQIYPALIGQEGVSESGLLRSTHPSLAAARPFLNKVDEKCKAIAREAFELLRAGGSAHKARRDDLEGKVADLKSLLAQSAPKDRHLVPGGPEFPPNAAQVARGPGH